MILGLLLLTADVAHAQRISMMGSGEHSCGRLIADLGSAPPGPGNHKEMNTPSGVFVNEYTQYQEWLMGFVSGFNSAHANDVEQQVTIDLVGMDLWMRNWCNQYPTKPVFEGASTFIDEMRTNAAARH
jgi:hypothetical protein